MKKRSILKRIIVIISFLLLVICYSMLQAWIENIKFVVCLFTNINVLLKNLWELLTNPIVLITIIILWIIDKRNSVIQKLSKWVSELKIGPVSAKFDNDRIIPNDDQLTKSTLTDEEKSISLELVDNVSIEVCRILLRINNKEMQVEQLAKIVAEETIKSGEPECQLSLREESFCLGLLGGIFRAFTNIWFDLIHNNDKVTLKVVLFPKVKSKIVSRVYDNDEDIIHDSTKR